MSDKVNFSVAARRALHAVLESGSYAAAARSLGVTQPAVAQQIKELERQCGAALFWRQNGELVLTSFGDELTVVTEQINMLEAKAKRIIDRRHSVHTGHLKIGLGNSMPAMALISAFQMEYPDISLSVELGDFANIIKGVLEGLLDIGVLPNVPSDGRFHRETLVKQEVVAITHPDDPLSRFDQVDCAQLMQRPLIFRSRGSSTQEIVNTAFRKAGLSPTARLVLNSRDGVYEAVANKLGVGFMWRHGTGRTDQIHRVPVSGMGPPSVESVFRLSEASDPVMRAFFIAARNFRRQSGVA